SCNPIASSCSTRWQLRIRGELRLEHIEAVAAEDHAPPQHERIGEERVAAGCHRHAEAYSLALEQVDDRFIDVAVGESVGQAADREMIGDRPNRTADFGAQAA